MIGPNAPPQAGQQNYRTPKPFLDAVLRRLMWDKFDLDLACTQADCVAEIGIYHDLGLDALALDWPEGKHYVNPPFGLSKAFAAACAKQCSFDRQVAMLVPASVGSAWFAEHVDGKADVIFLRPRIVFLQPDGAPCPAGINRDCMLVVYGYTTPRAQGGTPEYTCEDWRKW